MNTEKTIVIPNIGIAQRMVSLEGFDRWRVRSYIGEVWDSDWAGHKTDVKFVHSREAAIALLMGLTELGGTDVPRKSLRDNTGI